jgi:hypothetical protein
VKDVSSRITGFSNSKTGPGADLTINGSQLQNVQRIFIGDKVIAVHQFISHTESAITFTVPVSVLPNTGGEKTDVLVVFSGSDRAYNEIEVVPLQAISSFIPYSASTTGGDVITLTGANFDLVTGVKLGDLDGAIIPGTRTSTLLQFTVPAGFNANSKITLTGNAGDAKSSTDLIACTSPTVSDCAPGLNLNTSFEVGTGDDFTDWIKNNGGGFQVAATVPGEYFRGSRGLKVVRDGSLGSGQWRIQASTSLVTTEIGASYTVYVWARASAAGAGFRVSLNPDSGFYPGDVPVTTAWQRISFVVPGERITTTSTRFVLDMNGTNTCCNPAVNFFFDDIKVIKN